MSLQQERYDKMISAMPDIDLSDNEQRYLMWLAGWDGETQEVFTGLFGKLLYKQSHEVRFKER